MKWNGTKEFIIGEFDSDTGKVSREFRIKPGQEIPEEAMAIVRESIKLGELSEIPYFDDGYGHDLVQKHFSKEKK